VTIRREISRVLGPAQPGKYTAVVIEVLADTLTIQTGAGAATVARPPGLPVSVNDEVLVVDGAVQGRVSRSADLPTYPV
jgi:hypothetical protein